MIIESLRTVRDRLSEFVARVQLEQERLMITRNGSPAAVLVSASDLESLEETLEILADGKAVRELRQAELAIEAGGVARGADSVRQLRAR